MRAKNLEAGWGEGDKVINEPMKAGQQVRKWVIRFLVHCSNTQYLTASVSNKFDALILQIPLAIIVWECY